MSEKCWRARWTGHDGKVEDSTFEYNIGEPAHDPGAMQFAILIAIESAEFDDLRKPFVYFDDHARGPLRATQPSNWWVDTPESRALLVDARAELAASEEAWVQR